VARVRGEAGIRTSADYNAARELFDSFCEKGRAANRRDLANFRLQSYCQLQQQRASDVNDEPSSAARDNPHSRTRATGRVGEII